jgi:copper resistance protein C
MMSIRTFVRLGASLGFALSATVVFAHAQLDKATPPVGGTVSPPSEIRLKFTEGVEPRFSGVTLSAAGGAAQTLGKASVDPADNTVLIVKVTKKLPPGVYTVNWHAVSVDTHHTQGSFNFTVAP